MDIRKPDILHNYLRHKDINNYLDYLSHRYSDFVSIISIGKSFEGRELKAIKIDLYKKAEGGSRKPIKTTGASIKKPKKWILIESGAHAREWITTSVALYCIYQLTEKSLHNREILEKINFIIVPLLNADGYEYSHDKNPFWRKNRRPVPGRKVIGIDCNRNYDFKWELNNSNKTKNFKTKLSKSTYRGEIPFSEAESCAIRNIMQKFNTNLKFFLSFHAYAESIMYPWGYTKELPATWKDLHALADCGRKAIEKATGRRYRCGSISKVFRRTYSGSVVDYAYGAQKIPYVLVMELPSLEYGFHPPREKIKSITEESWIGVRAMCMRAAVLS